MKDVEERRGYISHVYVRGVEEMNINMKCTKDKYTCKCCGVYDDITGEV